MPTGPILGFDFNAVSADKMWSLCMCITKCDEHDNINDIDNAEALLH